MTPPAAEQAQDQSQTAVHSASVAATTALNKLAQALQAAGVDAETVKQVDDMSNAANEIASAAVGNTPAPAAPEEPAYSPTPGEPPGGLGSEIADFAAEGPSQL